MSSKHLVIIGFAVLCVFVASLRIEAGEETLEQRRARLAKMSDAEKTRLLQKKQRFEQLSAEQQERLRKVYHDLANAPDYAELRKTLQRYNDWLKTLAPLERAELFKLPAEKRLVRVRELMDAQAKERFRWMVSNVAKSRDLLSHEDLNVISEWTDKFLIKHADAILATVPDNRFTAEVKASFDPRKHIHILRFCYFRFGPRFASRPSPGTKVPPGLARPEKERDQRTGNGSNQAKEPTKEDGKRRSDGGDATRVAAGTTEHVEPLPRPSPEDEAELAQRVSPRARAVLEQATNSEERSQIIHNWMRAAVISRVMPPVSAADLDRFVRSSLSREERERLESMPRDRMYNELRKLYFRKRFESGRRGKRPRSGARRDGGPPEHKGPPGGGMHRDGRGRGPMKKKSKPDSPAK